MDIRTLNTFLTLCKTLNYQRAAELLQYAPNSLTKHIQHLEEDLGVELFCKNGRNLQITEDGLRFQEHAMRILEEYHHALDSFSGKQTEIRNIRVGGCELNASYCQNDAFTAFLKKHENVHLDVFSSPNASVPDMLRDKLVDMGFYIRLSLDNIPDIMCTPLYRETVHLLVSSNNPLAAKSSVRYSDLAGVPLSFPHKSCCMVQELINRIADECPDMGEITYLGGYGMTVNMALNHGAAIIAPYSSVNLLCNSFDLQPLALQEKPLWIYQCVLYASFAGLSPVSQALIRHCIDFAQEQTRLDCVHFQTVPQSPIL